MNRLLVLLALVIPVALAAADQSPYAGEQHRAIKSLSPQEIRDLRSGAGMGFAKLAELNRYPGPRHVIDLSDELGLEPGQVDETMALFAVMHERAVILGVQLIEAETALDEAFRERSIDAESLRKSLLEIGRIRAELRFVHLEAHLRQAEILTEAQIRHYDRLRGYSTAKHGRH